MSSYCQRIRLFDICLIKKTRTIYFSKEILIHVTFYVIFIDLSLHQYYYIIIQPELSWGSQLTVNSMNKLCLIFYLISLIDF